MPIFKGRWSTRRLPYYPRLPATTNHGENKSLERLDPCPAAGSVRAASGSPCRTGQSFLPQNPVLHSGLGPLIELCEQWCTKGCQRGSPHRADSSGTFLPRFDPFRKMCFGTPARLPFQSCNVPLPNLYKCTATECVPTGGSHLRVAEGLEIHVEDQIAALSYPEGLALPKRLLCSANAKATACGSSHLCRSGNSRSSFCGPRRRVGRIPRASCLTQSAGRHR